ncbi:hypothetical protein ABWED_0806 [Acinetobacter lwoffii]|nr:hypothetical protein ABEKA_1640 [Acinetobacter lwoffii]UVB00111.1 hypothetical protein ABWED_0806 [Acinetobacter lwoffii]
MRMLVKKLCFKLKKNIQCLMSAFNLKTSFKPSGIALFKTDLNHEMHELR